ncbi:MAG: aldehyde dehydrogenase family protein [Myxococcales bacterium]
MTTSQGRKGKHLAIAGEARTSAPLELRPVCPIDLRPLAPVTVATAEQIEAAVGRARRAQDAWGRAALSERVGRLETAAKEMLRRRGEVAELARQELGKVAIEGLFNEGLGPLETVRGWAGIVARATCPRKVRLNPVSFPRKSAEVHYLPRGVVGIIAPWNYPVAGLYRSMIPALMTGNAVVLKPSEYTPRTSAWLAQRLAAALPEGLVEVVQGDGEVGRGLIDAGLDACVFTGSPESGRKVRLQCAERGIPASVEMGGKDAALVLADCDMERSVAGVTHWALSNVGQACGAIEVAYVDERIADAFVGRLARAWAKLRTGAEQDSDLGPLGNRRQLDLVLAQLADARAKGAVVVCGGEPEGGGLFLPATLLDRCTPEMAVVRDETFGPVLAVVRVSGAEEAVRQINQGRYGLGASIWTSDLARARRLAERLDVGIVDVNNHGFTGAIPQLPWSGTRATGHGVANGPESLGTFVRPKTMVVDRLGAPEPFWMPYDRALWTMGDVLADAQLGKVASAWKLPLLWKARLATIRRFFA